ncbi:hypothetical protein QJS10_CPB12g00643 [Acorus calamus]|uniref:Uncharacterized protein n=1 Tax=Acorus calamus TaxID=4465 RepID=A0AAV9DPB7_ACOCL|nr:hypothetical protein QJS10_CPB12g00643 [Acorus calamus]
MIAYTVNRSPTAAAAPTKYQANPMVDGTAVTQFGMGGAHAPPHQSPPQSSSSPVAAGEQQ